MVCHGRHDFGGQQFDGAGRFIERQAAEADLGHIPAAPKGFVDFEEFSVTCLWSHP